MLMFLSMNYTLLTNIIMVCEMWTSIAASTGCANKSGGGQYASSYLKVHSKIHIYCITSSLNFMI